MFKNSSRIVAKICRTCMGLITDNNQVVHLSALVKSETNATTIRERLKACVPELHLDDKLSVVICSSCATALNFCHEFKHKCINSETQLRKCLPQQRKKQCVQGVQKAPSVSTTAEETAQLPRVEFVDVNSILVSNDTGPADKIIEGNDTDSLGNDEVNWLPSYTVPDVKDVENDAHATGSGALTPSNTLLPEDQCIKTVYKCNVCAYRASLKIDIQRHMNTHAREKATSNINTVLSYNILRSIKKSRPLIKSYKCNRCDFSTLTQDVLISHHMNSHNKSQNEGCLACEHCNYSTFHKPLMDRHLASHGLGKVFNCDECGYTTPRKAQLTLHKKNCHKSAIFKCSECPFTANAIAALRNHVHIQKVDDLTRTKCSKRLFPMNYLNAHKKTHGLSKHYVFGLK